MRRVVALAVLFAAFAPVATATAEPRIAAVHSNPVTPGDRGEFVVVRFPECANRLGYALADGDARVSLGNGTVADRVVLSPDPAAARNLTDTPVRSTDLLLANGGGTIQLLRDGRTVDVLRYETAPEGELRTPGGWRPLGATDLSVSRADPTTARAFVLPDAPGAPARRYGTPATGYCLLATRSRTRGSGTR